MSENSPETLDNPSALSEAPRGGHGRMTTLECAALLLQEIAEPRPVGDSVKAAITRAARAVNVFLGDRETLSYGRAEDLRRREARRIDAHELDAIRAAHRARDQALRAELRAAAVLVRAWSRRRCCGVRRDRAGEGGAGGAVSRAARFERLSRLRMGCLSVQRLQPRRIPARRPNLDSPSERPP